MRSRTLASLIVVAVTAASTSLVPLGPDAGSAASPELVLGQRLELKHPGKGHEIHLSGVSVAAAPDGGALVTWGADEGQSNRIYVARLGAGEPTPVRVNPDDLSMEALHHPPRLVVAPAGEIYLSWSSAKPIPEGTLFASDLRLSRSVDGGKSFVGHLRVNEDRSISHSFDGLAAASDGTVLVSWLDSRAGGPNAGTYLARVVEAGTRVDRITRVGEDTCVCCRVDAAAGPAETVAIIWRKVFPGDIRDMVLSASRDGGRTFGPASLVASIAGGSRPARIAAARWASTAADGSTPPGTPKGLRRAPISTSLPRKTAAPSGRSAASTPPPPPSPTTRAWR